MKISASLDCANYMALGEEIHILEQAGIDYLHVDIIDGEFAPNFAIGTGILKRLGDVTDLPIDLHLMLKDPERHLAALCPEHVTRVIFHIESTTRPFQLINRIKAAGKQTGIAINPATPVQSIEPLIPYVDKILVMSVDPGFPGQTFIPEVMPKIEALSRMIRTSGRRIELEVDGAMGYAEINAAMQAGADSAVAGTSALFVKGESLRQAAEKLVQFCHYGLYQSVKRVIS